MKLVYWKLTKQLKFLIYLENITNLYRLQLWNDEWVFMYTTTEFIYLLTE